MEKKGDAYKSFIYSLFDEFANDLPIFFDRYSPMGRFPSPPLLEDSLDNVGFLTKHLEQGELSYESLKLFKDLREVSSPVWETATILLDRLEIAETEIKHRLGEVY